jgi:hypothetical protein
MALTQRGPRHGGSRHPAFFELDPIVVLFLVDDKLQDGKRPIKLLLVSGLLSIPRLINMRANRDNATKRPR